MRTRGWPERLGLLALLGAVGASAATAVSAATPGDATVKSYVVHSDSMSPTLEEGEVIEAADLAPGDSPREGQVVVLRSPLNGELLVKRVVATGGQSVALEDALLVVDGRTVAEPHVDHLRIDGVYFGPVSVPIGHVFLMGDNRAESVDSRAFGPVALNDVVAIVTEAP